MITYPDKPWADGQTFKYTTPEGEEVLGTYDESKNAWTFTRVGQGGSGPGGIITTADVKTLNARPDVVRNPFSLTDDPNTLVTQQEANWYLLEDIAKKERKVIVQSTVPLTHPLYTTDEGELINGDFWYDTDLLELFIYWQGAWFPTTVPPADYDLEIEQFQYDVNRLKALLDELYLFSQTTDDKYVKKTGGDEMEGPFKVTANPDIPGSRDSRRIETFGVFSGSDTTALRFGTTRDRIYVGHDDTSFNGLVKIDRIAEKNAGNSVKFENDIKMGINQIKNLAEATDDKDAVTYGQVKEELGNLRDEVLQGGAVLTHSPYIANMTGTKSGVDSSTPGPNEVAGFYSGGSSEGSKNQFPGNFNSYLKCGLNVISVQNGTNDYAQLPNGHDERWTGTVSVIDKNNGGLLYKNTIVKVTRSGEYVYIWVREPGSDVPNKPMLGYGNIGNWTDISVLIEGYRVK